MTKKHYEAIACEISFLFGRNRTCAEIIAHRLADYFQQDNPRFDRERFLKACGIEQETNKLDDYRCSFCLLPFGKGGDKCHCD